MQKYCHKKVSMLGDEVLDSLSGRQIDRERGPIARK